MDSPYRSAELDVFLSASRGDRRCSAVSGVCRVIAPGGRGSLRRAYEAGGLLLAAVLVVGGIAGIAACVQACVMITTFHPRPVMLSVERAVPASPRLEVSSPLTPRASPAPLPVPLRSASPSAALFPAGLLSVSEPVTRDPFVLRVRARELAHAGLVSNVADVVLPPWGHGDITPFLVSTTKPPALGLGPDGITIGAVPRASLLARAGLGEGDLVLSVDGYAGGGTEWLEHAFRNADRGGLAVVELLRAGERIVLAITWPPLHRD